MHFAQPTTVRCDPIEIVAIASGTRKTVTKWRVYWVVKKLDGVLAV